MALLEALDERIFAAEAAERADDRSETVSARSARLTAETAWGVDGAARFALDCAAHSLGAAAPTAFPDGSTLGDVVAEARVILDQTNPDGEERLGMLARFAGGAGCAGSAPSGDASLADRRPRERPRQARRPRLDDARGGSEAVLAALEALRPSRCRATRTREEPLDEHQGRSAEHAARPLPRHRRGRIVLGAEHHSPGLPAAAAARDAAARARESAC